MWGWGRAQGLGLAPHAVTPPLPAVCQGGGRLHPDALDPDSWNGGCLQDPSDVGPATWSGGGLAATLVAINLLGVTGDTPGRGPWQ